MAEKVQRYLLRQFRLSATVKGGPGFVLKSADYARPPHISFYISRSDTQSSNTCRMTITNLTDEQKAIIRGDNCRLVFESGYGKRIAPIYSGTISDVQEGEWNSTQAVTIQASDGFESNDQLFSLSLEGEKTCYEVAQQLLSMMDIPTMLCTAEAETNLNSALGADRGWMQTPREASYSQILRFRFESGCGGFVTSSSVQCGAAYATAETLCR